MRKSRMGIASVFLAAGLLAAGCQHGKGGSGAGAGPAGGTAAAPGSAASGAAPDVAGGTPVKLEDGGFFADPLTYLNLIVWPIIAEKVREVGEYLSLKQAQDAGAAEIREVGAAASAQAGAGPAVNTIAIENKGDLPILVCAGTIVKGGNQDRQVGQDFVIAPKSTAPVDAFCVEHGRWQGTRDGKGTAGQFFCVDAVAPKQVREAAVYARDQGAVWQNVRSFNSLYRLSPGTGTLLASVEEAGPEALARREDMAKAIRARFQELRAQGRNVVGFAYAVNGKAVAARRFAHPRILEGQLESFVKAMCLEADGARAEAETSGPAKAQALAKVPPAEVEKLMAALRSAKEEVSASAAANWNGLRRCELGGSSTCYVRPAAPAAPAVASAAATEPALVPIAQDWTVGAGN